MQSPNSPEADPVSPAPTRAAPSGSKAKKGNAAQHATHRTAILNDATQNAFCDNTISTSKYTMWSFVPRSLFEQFRRIANVYFLGISILMLLGTYLPKIFESPLSAYSTLGPLCIVLAITMAKEGAEDYKRHQSDREVNNRKCTVLGPGGSEREVLWQDIAVGSIIKVANKGEVPADIIVLQTSEPKAVSYVETSNIDGETNLKLKEAVAPAAAVCPTGADLGDLAGQIEYDQPNDRIHNFTGRMRLTAGGALGKDGSAAAHVPGLPDLKAGDWFPVGARNMVLRGCTLRNTKWLLGLVVYTGQETKVMKKSGGARSKMSQVEKTMNTCIKIIFGAQAVLCTVTTIAEAAWRGELGWQYPYLMSTAVELWIPQWLGNWFTFLLLFNNFIPISLYVTVELVNYIQAAMIATDADMYDPECDTPAKARTSNLNQDLGQIEYVFSDKTGTLTRNIMEFKQASIAGKVFGTFVPEAVADEEEAAAAATGEAAAKPTVDGAAAAATPGKPKQAPGVGSGFDDEVLMSVIRHGMLPPSYGQHWLDRAAAAAATAGVPPSYFAPYSREEVTALEAFFACMAVCHTVVPEADEKGGPPIYQAESPDEAALTKAAREVGFEFLQRHADHIIVRRTTAKGSVDLKFMTLGVHDFNSTRKRMSVVVRAPDGRYLIMCKGADNVMFDRSHTEGTRGVLDTHLTAFASTGLRTLVLAQREMSAAEFAAWQAEYNAAAVSLTNREGMLADVAEKYEKEFHVLGATAIEDRLQEGVPSTIRDLRRAGIKTWVLTGDKVETAINIGFSCRLLDPSMELIKITSEDPRTVKEQLSGLQAQFQTVSDDPVGLLARFFKRKPQRGTVVGASRTASGVAVRVDGSASASSSALQLRAPSAAAPSIQAGASSIAHNKVETDMAIIITGQALSHVLGDPDAERALLTVAQVCKSVVACRVSPAQKAAIVKLVRQGISPKPLTLAIGDGANDVGMIQRAEVGVGISGKEGLQAVNAADFAIAQFRFLKRLLLVHGRWDYRRMTKVVLYSFYKNVVITLSLFYFNALTGFSGTSMYESLVYSSYNFVLGLPIVFIGILDQDISAKTALAHPSVYATGLFYMDLNVKKMLQWIGKAVAHSAIVFWVPYGCYSAFNGSWDPSGGKVDGLAVAGLTTFSSLVWGMQLTVSLQTLHWTWLNHLFLWLSIAGFYVFILLYSNLYSMTPEFYGVTVITLSRPAYWFMLVLVLGMMLLFDLTVELVRSQLFPQAIDIARELDRGFGAGDKARWNDEVDDAARIKEVAAAEGADSSGDTPRSGAAGATGASGAGAAPKNGERVRSSGDSAPASTQRKTGSGSGTGVTTASASSVSASAVVSTVSPLPAHGASPRVHTGGSSATSASGSSGILQATSPTGKVTPPSLPSSGSAAALARHPAAVDSEGGVYVPKEAVLEGADADTKAKLGITNPSKHKGFAYTHAQKRSVGTPLAPMDD